MLATTTTTPTAPAPKSAIRSATVRNFSSFIEIMSMIVITLTAILIILWFRQMFFDQAINSFEDCQQVYSNSSTDANTCVTAGGETWQIEPE